MRGVPHFRAKAAPALTLREALLLLAGLALSIAILPIGYVGGGGDDYHYLMNARCWAEAPPCIVDTHWSARWPLLAPMGATLAALGESHWAIGLVPTLYAAALLLSFTALGNAMLGRPVGLAGGALLLLLPAASVNWTKPNVDIPEAAWLMLGALLLCTKDGRKYALLAGAAFGMAIATRVTAMVAAPVAFLLILGFRRQLAPFVIGTALVLGLDILLNWWTTGDPLHRFAVALGHTQIHSDELATGTAEGSPILNYALIDGWRHQPGLEIHPLLDPILNLLANPKAGIALVMSLLIAPLAWPRDDKAKRCLSWLAAVAVGWLFALVYVLALDPKPRVLLMPLLTAHLIFAALLVSLWATGRRLIVGLIAAIVLLIGLLLHWVEPGLWPVEEEAKAWAEAAQDPVGASETVRRHLARGKETILVSESDEADRLLLRSQGSCDDLLAQRPGWRVSLDLPMQRTIGAYPSRPYRLCGIER